MAGNQEALSLDLAAGGSGAAEQPVAATVVDIEDDDDGAALEPQPKHQRILQRSNQIDWGFGLCSEVAPS